VEKGTSTENQKVANCRSNNHPKVLLLIRLFRRCLLRNRFFDVRESAELMRKSAINKMIEGIERLNATHRAVTVTYLEMQSKRRGLWPSDYQVFKSPHVWLNQLRKRPVLDGNLYGFVPSRRMRVWTSYTSVRNQIAAICNSKDAPASRNSFLMLENNNDESSVRPKRHAVLHLGTQRQHEVERLISAVCKAPSITPEDLISFVKQSVPAFKDLVEL
jgi:hypothetical protein